MKPLPPVIKWSGGKRRVASCLAGWFPETANTYYEPFVGGGALLPLRPCASGVAGDVIPELIALWLQIRDEPARVAEGYRERWLALQRQGHTLFYEIRDRFNEHRDPVDFLFLSRTCVNGLIRFNGDGDFNNSLHHTRPGIHPDRLERIITMWSAQVQEVAFLCADFRETLAEASEGDFVFLDPPYAGSLGRYTKSHLDQGALFLELERLTGRGVKWMLTYDGYAGTRDYRTPIPEALAVTRGAINSGPSSFPRLMNSRTEQVRESVFLNYHPVGKRAGDLAETI